MTILPIAPAGVVAAPSVTPAVRPATPSTSFEGVLGQAVQNLTSLQGQADQQAAQLASGQNVSLVDSVLAMEQTSLSFKLAMQVRDKAIGAYQDVMRMQV